MIDSNLILRPLTTPNISANELTPASLDFGGPDIDPVTYQVLVTGKSGTSPTLDVKIQESDDNTNWRDFLSFKQITDTGVYYVTGKSNARYRRYTATVGGTTPVFNNVLIAPVPAGRYNNY